MRFQDRVVIVTGASRGIGKAIAEAFGKEGAKVACVATSIGNAQGVAASIGESAKPYACNVAVYEEVEKMVEAVTSELGSPTILVNNAGVTRDTLMLRMKDSDWDDVLNTNLKGSYHCIKAVSRGMMKSRYGRIVNVSSVIGQTGAAGQANYAASKAGLIGLTKSVAKELGSRGITCNAVAPGFIDTDMTKNLPEEFRAQVIKTAPMGRLGDPADVAAAILFLASEEAAYITGQTLTVDGGLTL